MNTIKFELLASLHNTHGMSKRDKLRSVARQIGMVVAINGVGVALGIISWHLLGYAEGTGVPRSVMSFIAKLATLVFLVVGMALFVAWYVRISPRAILRIEAGSIEFAEPSFETRGRRGIVRCDRNALLVRRLQWKYTDGDTGAEEQCAVIELSGPGLRPLVIVNASSDHVAWSQLDGVLWTAPEFGLFQHDWQRLVDALGVSLDGHDRT